MGKVYYYNGAQILAPYTITSNEPHFDMTTVSLKVQRASQGHQRWELSFNTVITKDTEVDMLLSTMVDFDSSDTMIMPQLPSVKDNITLTSAPLLIASAQAGASTVYVDAGIANGIMPKGSFFKFSNHNKVYISTSDLNLDGATNKPLTFYPSLKSSVGTSTSIVHGDNCVISYIKNIDNQQGITFTDGILSNPGVISLIEEL
jgi:hypothetical protein